MPCPQARGLAGPHPYSCSTLATQMKTCVPAVFSGNPRRLCLGTPSQRVNAHAGKGGFGNVPKKPKPQHHSNTDAPLRGSKKNLQKKESESPIPGQDSQKNRLQAITFRPGSEAEALMKQAESIEFGNRLAQLKASGQEKIKEVRAARMPGPAEASMPEAKPADGAGVKAETKSAGLMSMGSKLMPQKFKEKLLGELNSDISDPKLRNAKVGPGQVAIAAGAVVFGLAFVAVAGGDFTTTNRYKGVHPAQPPPDAITEGILNGQADMLKEALRLNPGDEEALEGLALTYAQLFKFDKAADLLDRLTQRRPSDPEVWRLLGESRLLAAQPARAVAAYERAVGLSPEDVKVVTGLVDSYIANSQQAKAVAYLQGLKDKLAATASSSGSGSAAAAAALQGMAAAAPSATGDATTTASTTPSDSIASTTSAAISDPSTSSTPAASTKGASSAIFTSATASTADVSTGTSSPSSTAPDLRSSSSSSSDPSSGANNDLSRSSTPSTSSPTSSAIASSSSSMPEPLPAPDLASPPPSSSEPITTTGSKSSEPATQIRPLDPVSIDLLLGKAYGAWRGHDKDALSVYDQLLKNHPGDYRVYLAKAVFLKDLGRKADAESLFMQAQLHAPRSQLALVKAKSEAGPVLDLPDS